MSIVITIDGPAASGKTTAGILLAQTLGFQFVDSGSIYRIGTYLLHYKNYSIDNISDCVSVFEGVDIDFQIRNEDYLVFVNGENVSEQLHTLGITKIVPKFAAIPEVRSVVKKKQRELGNRQNTVMTGRDTGTEIYPDAPLKFFLIADAGVRARRRMQQLIAEGDSVAFQEVFAEIVERDRQDAERTASPLRKADDAIEIDTTNLTIRQTFDRLFVRVQEHLHLQN